MAPSFLTGFTNLLQQVNGVQTLRLGMERLTGWARGFAGQAPSPVPGAGSDLAADSARLRQVVAGATSSDLDNERRMLRARILFLQQAYRVLLPLNGQVSRLSEESFQDAKIHIRLALNLLRRMKFEDAAVRVQIEMVRAEKSLARGHVEMLFDDPKLANAILNCPFGRWGETLSQKDDVLAKIESEGLDGYLEFLIAALNQRWSSVVTLESLRERLGHLIDDEMLEEHQGSVVLILGLLAVIERDSHIVMKFRDRWDRFSPRHSLELVRAVSEDALAKKNGSGS